VKKIAQIEAKTILEKIIAKILLWKKAAKKFGLQLQPSKNCPK
jgi:hypothetical protein